MAQKLEKDSISISKAVEILKNVQTVKDLSKYGKEFQLKLVSLLMKDRIFSFSIIPIIKNEYFSDAYLRMIFVMISQYVEKYHSLPQIDNIRIELNNIGENPVLYDKILSAIDTVKLDDRDFVMDNARKFCFSRHALAELEKVKEHLIVGEFDKAKAISMDSFKFSGINQTKIYNLKEHYNRIYDASKEHNPIPTPFKTFNENMNGGPGKGNLAIMVAPSNFGKSNLLIAFSRHANTLNKKVIFFSFEIGGIDMLRRHIAGLTDIRQEDVQNHKDFIEARMQAPGLGEFILVEERATTARISTMKNHVEYFKSTGFYPDMIMVDALNQLKLPLGMKYESDNQKFEYLAEELRDWSNDEQLPLYTVFQTNRAGFKATINDEETIGKAIEPFQVADVVIAYSQPPEMRNELKCYANLLKNRLGKKGIVLECYYDPNKCIFAEIQVVNDLVLLDSRAKENLNKTAQNTLHKIRNGAFDKKTPATT